MNNEKDPLMEYKVVCKLIFSLDSDKAIQRLEMLRQVSQERKLDFREVKAADVAMSEYRVLVNKTIEDEWETFYGKTQSFFLEPMRFEKMKELVEHGGYNFAGTFEFEYIKAVLAHFAIAQKLYSEIQSTMDDEY